MWYLYQKGGIHRYRAKFLHLKIWRKYGCCIFPIAVVGKGFFIVHPVGIVIGKAVIGENFTIYQNCTLGVRRPFDESKGRIPHIGNNVKVCTNAVVLGDISLCDDTIVAAGAVLLKDALEPGVYAGVPARRVK